MYIDLLLRLSLLAKAKSSPFPKMASSRLTRTGHTIWSPIIRNLKLQQQCKGYGGSRRSKELDPHSPLLSPELSSSRFGLVTWYLGMVKNRPIVTKSLTSAFIYTAADLTSQTVTKSSGESYDLARTSRMGGCGMLLVGPTLHYWFNFVSKILPKRDFVSTLKKTALGQTVYGPCITAAIFAANAALQGERGEEIIARLKRDVVPTMVTGVMYWPLCDFVTFKFVPVHLQPLVSNSFSYLWNVYMTYMASLKKASSDG